MSGLANAKAFLSCFKDYLYVKWYGIYYYDGTTAKVVSPYIPIVSQGREIDGTTSQHLYEPLNFLTGAFTDMFSPDGVAKSIYNEF